MERATFTLPKKRTNETERGELLRYFLERLNASREKAGFAPLTFPRVGHLLAGIPTKDLYALQSSIKDLDDERASKKFYYLIRPTKENV